MTEFDRRLLERRSFLEGYRNNWKSLVDPARAVFRATTWVAKSSPPRPDDLVEGIALALLTNEVFKQLCWSREYPDEHLHLTFARAMARHILDSDWPVITASD